MKTLFKNAHDAIAQSLTEVALALATLGASAGRNAHHKLTNSLPVAYSPTVQIANGSNQLRQISSNSAPVAFNRPLHLNCYTTVAY
jgi:hypothetical protein